MALAYERLTGRLSEVTGYTPPRDGAEWRCPAHDDNSPSLSVTAVDGRVLVHCQAGCELANVLAALKMADSDLFDEPLTNGNGKANIDSELWTPYGEAVAIYDYVDETGKTLFQVCRTAAKEFPVRVPDATKKGGYRWKWGETRRVIYRLPNVLQARSEGWRIWIVEGEKDVHALERVGEVATCNPGGAGKWRPEYCEWLEDADVVIVADNDSAGAKHARRTSAMLRGIARSVSIVQALTGKDAADHMNAGHSLDEFVPFMGPTDDPSDEPGPTGPDGGEESAELTHFRSWLLDTQGVLDLPPPEWLLDGVLVQNSLAVVWGAPGSAKSFLALDWALCVASGTWWKGRKVEAAPVVYMAAEGVAGLGKRIKAWSSANNVRSLDRARWLAGAVNLLNPAEADALFTLVGEHSPKLVIVDTLARSMLGGDENAAQDMGRAIAVLDQLRAVSGATVVVIHHATKEGSSARGSSALRGAVDTEIEVKKEGHDVSVFCRKQKDAELFPGISLRLVVEQPSCVLNHLQIGHENKGSLSGVLASVKVIFHESFGESGASAAELRKATMETLGVSEAMYYRIRNALLTEGFMVNKGTSRYPFFEPGENYTNVVDLQTCKSLATHLQDGPNLLAATLPPLRGGGLQVKGESQSESKSEDDQEGLF